MRWIKLLSGKTTDLWRSLSSRRRNAKRPRPAMLWAVALAAASLACAFVALSGLHYAARGQRENERVVTEKERAERLEEAARAWAIQETLQKLPAAPAPGAEGAEQARLRAKTMAEAWARARAALHLGARPPGLSDGASLFEDPFLPGTPFRAQLLSIAARGSAALLAISVLCLIAILFLPVLTRLLNIGEKRVDEATQPPAAGSVAASAIPIVVPMSGATPPGVAVEPPNPVAPPSGPLPVFRPGLVPSLLAAGVIVTMGAVLITVPGSQMEVAPTVDRPGVGVKVKGFNINVDPGEIDVPAILTSAEGPKVSSKVPQILFNFPASRVEQQALTALTQELAEYRRTLGELAQHDERLSQLREANSKLVGENSALQAKLELLPSRQELTDLKGRIDSQGKLEEEFRKSVETGLQTLANSSAMAHYGDSAAAGEFARRLNAQNRKLFNQVFRPGLIRENCRIYAALADHFTIIPECTETWLHDRLSGRKPSVEAAKSPGASQPQAAGGAPSGER